MANSIVARDHGHSFYQEPALNSASAAYICILTVYSGVLLYTLCGLFKHRKSHPMRVRSFPMTLSAVLAIHFYVSALFIVYPLNEDFKCGTEFWIMNTALPSSMALFQACHVRLLSYAKLQNQLAEMECFSEKKKHPVAFTPSGMRKWFFRLSHVQKTYAWISICLCLQIGLAFFLFFGSRRFSPSTGFFGQHVDRTSCRRGYEWSAQAFATTLLSILTAISPSRIPSVAWQFVWTWVIGPVILFKTRHIRDMHYFALQTRLCIIAGLPGTPMWLCFLYISTPATAKINPWWPPAMWFAPGLMTMCLTSLFLPACDIYCRWVATTRGGLTRSLSSSSTLGERPASRRSKDLAHSYPAFEFQLKHNPQPLLHFAARKDFTSENILFLRAVRDFKLKWRRHIAMAPSIEDCLSDRDMRAMYEDAARIYFELINPETAIISVNLDSRMFEQFQLVFSHVTYDPPDGSEIPASQFHHRRRSRSITGTFRRLVAPWESIPSPEPSDTTATVNETHSCSETGLTNAGTENSQQETHADIVPPICQLLGITLEEFALICENSQTRGRANPVLDGCRLARLDFALGGLPFSATAHGKISGKPNGSRLTYDRNFVPAAFSLDVFDKAYHHIKYLVYHNTWKTYVEHLDAVGVQRLAMLYNSEDTLVSRRWVNDSSGNPFRYMTDAELYELNLELEAERDGTNVNQVHHGVLDPNSGPVPMAQVDARCSGCRSGSRTDKIKHIMGLGYEHNYVSSI